jgi:predicted amidohydrolase
MKIAALQMVSTPDVERNLAAAARLAAEAAAAGAQLVALPEYFCLLGRSDRDKLAIAEALGEGPIQEALAAMARDNGLFIIGGTLPLRTDDPERVRNTCLVFGPDGARLARYDKLHLFAFDNGTERYDEGRVLEAGADPVAFDASGLRVGLSICYDLRFPALYRALAQAGAQILAVPSAFMQVTGEAHWHVLLRARAIETGCFVIAPAQCGVPHEGRASYGHSLIVGPWGDVLADAGPEPGVVVADLALAQVMRARRRIPSIHQQYDFTVEVS